MKKLLLTSSAAPKLSSSNCIIFTIIHTEIKALQGTTKCKFYLKSLICSGRNYRNRLCI